MSLTDSLPAIGAGVAVGMAAYYLARLLLQRTPLERDDRIAQVERGRGVVHRPREGRGAR